MKKSEPVEIELRVDGVARRACVGHNESRRFLSDIHTLLDAIGFGEPGAPAPSVPGVMTVITRRMVASSYTKDAPYSSLARLLSCTKSSVRHYALRNLDALEGRVGLMFTDNWCDTGAGFPISACLSGVLVDGVVSDYIDGDTIEDIAHSYALPADLIASIISDLGVEIRSDEDKAA